ncbi:MAG: hypothetical protein QN160_09960, partial [Armatimonadota bacterium]|nr:hypothetical protein [Armatimonadota bacterium]
HAIGFLEWKDFVDEIRRLRPRTVRVQAYETTRFYPDLPAERLFWVEAAFMRCATVYFVRFRIGSALEFQPAELHEEMIRRADLASAVLHAALAPLGVEIRRGLFHIPRAIRKAIVTSPDGLWRFERDGDAWRLVPETIPQEVPA